MYSRVYVEITNICNMHCSFCHGHKRKPGKMDPAQFSRVLDQLTGQTGYIYYHLMGEPLLHPELPTFLEMAASRGFKSIITTNGTLLHKCGKALIGSPLHKVSVSLHSFEQDDEETFLGYLSQVANFAEEASQAGIIVSLRLWNRGYDEGRNDTAVAFLRDRFPDPWTENSKGFRLRDKLFLEWGDRFAWPDREAPVYSDAVFCHGMRDQFGILCDGTVVPCCLDSEGVINLGNIFTQEITDILSSPRATAMAQGFACRKATEDLCRRCGYAQRFG